VLIVVFPPYQCSLHIGRAPNSFPTRRSSDLHAISTANPESRPVTGSRVALFGFPKLIPTRNGPRGARSFNTARSRSPSQFAASRSEEHTSELQSHLNLVCRYLLENNK